MSKDLFSTSIQQLRATDSNTLLRLYDQVADADRGPLPQNDRRRAGIVLRRIAAELTKRNVPFTAASLPRG